MHFFRINVIFRYVFSHSASNFVLDSALIRPYKRYGRRSFERASKQHRKKMVVATIVSVWCFPLGRLRVWIRDEETVSCFVHVRVEVFISKTKNKTGGNLHFFQVSARLNTRRKYSSIQKSWL